jgi:hypothetical protein
MVSMPERVPLILKRSELAHAGFEDYAVLSDGKVVGRIYCDKRSTAGQQWFWGMASPYHRGLDSHGYVSQPRGRDGSIPQELGVRFSGRPIRTINTATR